jgi:hypothetical protein
LQLDSAFVFATERDGPYTPDAIIRLIKRIGERAGFAFPVHAHICAMLAATPWPMPATTRGAFRTGSAIARSSTRRERGAVQGLLEISKQTPRGLSADSLGRDSKITREAARRSRDQLSGHCRLANKLTSRPLVALHHADAAADHETAGGLPRERGACWGKRAADRRLFQSTGLLRYALNCETFECPHTCVRQPSPHCIQESRMQRLHDPNQ